MPELLDGVKPANTPAVRNDTTPGAFWRYSGGGITIAQLMSTDVTGETFPALMQRLVLKPAGMKHSTFENPPPGKLDRYAASGHERVDTPVPGRFHVYPEMAAAGHGPRRRSWRAGGLRCRGRGRASRSGRFPRR